MGIDSVCRTTVGSVLMCLIALSAPACAGKRARPAAYDIFVQKFVKPGEPTLRLDRELAAPSSQDMQAYTRQLRVLQSKATPKASLLPTIESRDRVLAEALARLALVESAENHRLVAAAYRKAGVPDYAHRHLQRALRLDPHDGAAYEAMAQLWRDWGMPDLALADAYRALHYRPTSASAYNTLGTIFEALGQSSHARQAFDQALALEPSAVFALNNLCYSWLQDGNAAAAEDACGRALVLEPTMTPARTNLALVYAIQGDTGRAEARLLEDPDRAAGPYNVAILRMSLGQYALAAQAFDVAAARRPSSGDARRRAAQARAKAAARMEP
jgi:Flp pilus assembly protein TadD